MTRTMPNPSARVVHADCLAALRDMPDALNTPPAPHMKERTP